MKSITCNVCGQNMFVIEGRYLCGKCKNEIPVPNPDPLATMLGLTLTKIEVDRKKDQIHFYAGDRIFVMYHEQECYETVTIEDINGDVNNLLHHTLLQAEVSTNSDTSKGDDSHTWTFYKFATVRGCVTIRWYGASNGYCSERVTVKELP